MACDKYPRETVVFIPIYDVEAPFEVSVARNYARPTTWNSALIIDGQPGFLLNAPALGGVGTYKVWVRLNANPETPVVEAGEFKIT